MCRGWRNPAAGWLLFVGMVLLMNHVLPCSAACAAQQIPVFGFAVVRLPVLGFTMSGRHGSFPDLAPGVVFLARGGVVSTLGRVDLPEAGAQAPAEAEGSSGAKQRQWCRHGRLIGDPDGVGDAVRRTAASADRNHF